MLQFRNNPLWGKEHVLIMDVLRSLKDGRFIHQKEIVSREPSLGPHKLYEQYLMETDKWWETTTRTVRGIINELANGAIKKVIKGEIHWIEFRPRIPIISTLQKNEGYRIAVDKEDYIKWWHSRLGERRWQLQAEGSIRSLKARTRLCKKYEKEIGGNGNGPDSPQLFPL